MRTLRWLLLVLVLALVATACSSDDDGDADDGDGAEATEDAAAPPEAGDETAAAEEGEGDVAQGGGTLAAVMDRGSLNCGVNDTLAGFGIVDAEGEFAGFDIDFCRAVAAALFDDPDAVSFVPLTADVRFTALQSGEVDVLIRNTTWTATRDGSEAVQFTATTFYDGQGMMVSTDTPFESVDAMDGTTICVTSGTTTELKLASQFEARGLTYEPLTFEDDDTLQEAFVAGQCDGWTTDLSGLAGRRSTFPDTAGGPESLRILPEVLSKEPLGPGTLQGDDEWFDVVQWVVFATIQAEEFGISSSNIGDFDGSDNPEIARFLGQESGFDPGLGLPSDFAVRVITQVGNYAEIFDRNVGPETPLGLERGVNALWTDGGLLYAPPYR